MNTKEINTYVEKIWDESIVSELTNYIKIPCKSPAYDADWARHGFIDQAITQMTAWAKKHGPKDTQVEILQLSGRTPLIYLEIPGQNDDTVLLYGHMDKQPEMTGWDEDLGPWKPVLRDNKLYGRGGADDGYAIFASLTAIRALEEQNIPHARCVILIEACEESGSYDLPFYIDHLSDRISTPSLIICLDSGCGNYQQLWSTTSLRGMVSGDLRIEILTEGVHSGTASGVVPSSFRILRQLLSRIEDEKTGKILLPECSVEIPKQRKQQAAVASQVLDKAIYQCFPFVSKANPTNLDPEQALLLRTWEPTLSVTGIAGIPTIESAGNVLRPYTTVKLSFRLPPTCDVNAAEAAIKRTLESDPPYKAKVTFTPEQNGSGWNAPAVSDWLAKASDEASQIFFGAKCVYMGEGGSIPFMGMLGEKFPQAQFLITGVLGPKSNAHEPNEFLHIPTGKKVTACVAYVLADHYKHT